MNGEDVFALMMICFPLLFFAFLAKAAISSSEKKVPLTDQLLKRKKITKEQYKQITDFEEMEKVKKKRVDNWIKAKIVSAEQAENILNLPVEKPLSFISILLYIGIIYAVIFIIALFNIGKGAIVLGILILLGIKVWHSRK